MSHLQEAECSAQGKRKDPCASFLSCSKAEKLGSVPNPYSQLSRYKSALGDGNFVLQCLRWVTIVPVSWRRQA